MGKRKKQRQNQNQHNQIGPLRQIKRNKKPNIHPSYVALQNCLRQEWITKQASSPAPAPTPETGPSPSSNSSNTATITPNFHINRTIAVANKEATITGFKVPSITIAVVNNNCNADDGSSSVDSEKKIDDRSNTAVGDSFCKVDSTMETCEDDISSTTGCVLESSEQSVVCVNSEDDTNDDLIVLNLEDAEMESENDEIVQQKAEEEVIVLDDSKSDAESDVIFVGKQMSYGFSNNNQTTSNKVGSLPSFIPLVANPGNLVPASELISRWRKSVENKLSGNNQQLSAQPNTTQQSTCHRKYKKNNFNKQLAKLKANSKQTIQQKITTKSNPSPLRLEINQTAKNNPTFNNLHNAGAVRKTGLREIIIDGSNVAFQHSQKRGFSVEGLKICIDYFLKRGHKVRAFVPQFRLKRHQSSNPKLLDKLCDQKYVVCTPSREVDGKLICSYDDRFIVECAAVLEGIIVSSDNFKDLWKENPNLRETIEKRLLMPTFVDDMIIFPNDPLGRGGPTLDEFLRFPESTLQNSTSKSISN